MVRRVCSYHRTKTVNILDKQVEGVKTNKNIITQVFRVQRSCKAGGEKKNRVWPLRPVIFSQNNHLSKDIALSPNDKTPSSKRRVSHRQTNQVEIEKGKLTNRE